jgi:hypothetical protein
VKENMGEGGDGVKIYNKSSKRKAPKRRELDQGPGVK